MLGQYAQLHRRAFGGALQARLDAGRRTAFVQPIAVCIVPDQAYQRRGSTDRDRIGRDVGGAAGTILGTCNTHDGHRCFRRNAIGGAGPVAIEHDIAHDQDAR